jgi:mRNA interferase MazF
LIYVPLTTQFRGSQYEVSIGRPPFLQEVSFANTQGVGSIPLARLERKLGALSPGMYGNVRSALRFALDL